MIESIFEVKSKKAFLIETQTHVRKDYSKGLKRSFEQILK